VILTIIQARLGSTRLPGKILLPIAGKPIIQHVYNAAPEPKVVAAPWSDHGLFHGFDVKNVVWYDGDPNDVLGRFYHTWRACKSEVDWILRLTADCPMLTQPIIRKFIIRMGQRNYDTIYTNRPWDPDGYDMELFSSDTLEMAHKYATDPYDREHVTPWIYRHFHVQRSSIVGRPVVPENPAEKVSVDTQENYEKVRAIMEAPC